MLKQFSLRKPILKKLSTITGISILDLHHIFDLYFQQVREALIEGKSITFGKMATIRPYIKKVSHYNRTTKKIDTYKVKRLKVNIIDDFKKELDEMGDVSLNIKSKEYL